MVVGDIVSALRAKVLVRVMCSFDVEVEHAGADVTQRLPQLANEAAQRVVTAVAAADFGTGIHFPKGASPTATPRRVEATLEMP